MSQYERYDGKKNIANYFGDGKVHETPLQQMRERGGNWYVYQNMALDHSMLGHVKFMKCGEGCTFVDPPEQYPDTPQEINWPYQYTGCVVDLEKGEIVKAVATVEEKNAE